MSESIARFSRAMALDARAGTDVSMAGFVVG
jgi:hypothetical protein